MRQVLVETRNIATRHVGRVSSIDDLSRVWEPGINFYVRVADSAEKAVLEAFRNGGVSNTTLLTSDPGLFMESAGAAVLDAKGMLLQGDVLAVIGTVTSAQVLYRESDLHHTVFITNRCNSYCVMCSQPPTPADDSWLLDEAEVVARHIGISPRTVGFTGGEPLLAGMSLKSVLETYQSLHPQTVLEVLTNGRMFGDPRFAKQILADLKPGVRWMVPLYGHADFLHDFVVQRAGAFEETLGGLLELQSYSQAVQLRLVLIKPVLEVLEQLAGYVARNLPFISEVALMGCEPTGFARANVELCKVDYAEYREELCGAVGLIEAAGIRPIIMNIPRCLLPKELWPYAHRSISDWKATYSSECEVCSVKSDCCGLFASHIDGWKPGRLVPIAGSA